MMGRAKIGGTVYVVSGAYGHDGLPLTVSREHFDRYGVPLPDDLRKKWNCGGGWNDAGLEAPAIREWALKTFPKWR